VNVVEGLLERCRLEAQDFTAIGGSCESIGETPWSSPLATLAMESALLGEPETLDVCSIVICKNEHDLDRLKLKAKSA
jgi:hypothetical protein